MEFILVLIKIKNEILNTVFKANMEGQLISERSETFKDNSKNRFSHNFKYGLTSIEKCKQTAQVKLIKKLIRLFFQWA